jgi:hypothetical protein
MVMGNSPVSGGAGYWSGMARRDTAGQGLLRTNNDIDLFVPFLSKTNIMSGVRATKMRIVLKDMPCVPVTGHMATGDGGPEK